MKPNELRAIADAGMLSAVFIALATIASEESVAFKGFLTSTFTHHWIGKGILALLVFGLVYFFQKNRVSSAKVDLFAMMKKIILVFVLSGAIIFAFFLWDVFKG